MGYQLVTEARWEARHLRSAPAVLALLEMAHHAKDTDPEPIYWAGWKGIALAIGYDPEHRDVKRVKTAKNAVSAAMRILRDHKLIVSVRGEAPGQNQRWGFLWRGSYDRNGPGNPGTERSREVRDDGPGNPGMTVPGSTGPEEPKDPTRSTAPDPSIQVPAPSPDRARDPAMNGIGDRRAGKKTAARDPACATAPPTNAAEPHPYRPDAHDVACEVCELPARHPRHAGQLAATDTWSRRPA